MGVRQVDGRKKKPDKPKVTVTKKGKKGSKGSLPRGVDPPVSTSQLIVQDDSELSCSIASCGSEVSAAVCNTSTIVGNFTGIDGSRGEHVLPRSVNNFPVGFSHGEHVLPNYPTASINSLQPNPNLIIVGFFIPVSSLKVFGHSIHPERRRIYPGKSIQALQNDIIIISWVFSFRVIQPTVWWHTFKTFYVCFSSILVHHKNFSRQSVIKVPNQ